MSGNKEVWDLCSDFWEWRMTESPEFASFCGDHRYDDRLDDFSLEAFKCRLEKGKEYLRQCDKLVERSDLSEDDRLNLRILAEELRTFISGMKYEAYVLAVTYAEGIHCEWDQLTSWMSFSTLEDFRKYSDRVKAIPKRVNQVEKLVRHGVEKGITHHKRSMEGVLESLDSLQCKAEDSVFLEPFNSTPEGLDKQEINALKQETIRAVKEEVQPAFDRLRSFIANEYIDKCRPQEGVSYLPNGDAFYQECLDWHLTLKMTPQEVHDTGLREVARIKKEMIKVIEKTGFTGNFEEFLTHLRTNKKFYFDSKEEIIAGFRDICDNKIRPNLTKLFHSIPKSKLVIEQVPESKKNGPAGYYLAGTLDGSRPGKFFVNCFLLDMCPKYEMMTLSLHEGEPGHHFQGMYSIEEKGVPIFRQYLEDMNYFMAPSRFPLNTAYCEGWGLYCEYLGNELGLYEDPYDLFGHLSFEMHRACRLVADTGIHAMGWTYDQGVQYFVDNTALSKSFIVSEVRRYITWPGQACAYKIGELKLKELRRKAAEKLGDDFKVADFHEVVLKSLMVPLTILETLVDRYIEKTLSQK